jgi:uncharacterized membrane protein
VFCGALVLLNPKGTRWHRGLGYAYVTAMAVTLVTALALYELTGAFNLLHVAALVSALTLLQGLKAVWQRRPGWLERHYRLMAWSYIGLIAALVSESAARFGMPVLAARGIATGVWFWGLVGASTFLVVLAGARLLDAHARRRRGSVSG